MQRREVITGIGAALLSAGVSPTIVLAQGSAKPLRITHAVTSLAYMQSYIAQQNGYFREAGFLPRSSTPVAVDLTCSWFSAAVPN